MLAEADAVLARRRCLIHGDFSPKNLLVGDDRLLMVDCEVAWFGDPGFDLAFYLNHLFLKSLYHHPGEPGLRELIDTPRGRPTNRQRALMPASSSLTPPVCCRC